MLVPRIFERKFIDDIFNDSFSNYKAIENMKTDVKENKDGYDVIIDMPGIKKEDIKAELKDGYLTVSAQNNYSSDEKNDEGKYIRRERYSGSVSRSFYVGENIKEEDIKAKFENGTLKLNIPKAEKLPEADKKKYIEISD